MLIGLPDYGPVIRTFMTVLGLSMIIQVAILALVVRGDKSKAPTWPVWPLVFAAIRCAVASIAFFVAVPFLIIFLPPVRFGILGASTVVAALITAKRCKPMATYILISVVADLIAFGVAAIALSSDPEVQVTFQYVVAPIGVLAILGVIIVAMRPPAR